MKVSNANWAEKLAGKMPENLAREIDIFETEIALRKQGKIDERLFAETRLRRGAYGQRYDNGQRHDGKAVQQHGLSLGTLTKGPSTMWDAPGMQRIKIPAGGLNAGATRNHGGSGRGIFGRHRARHHPAGFSASLRSHRGHAQR